MKNGRIVNLSQWIHMVLPFPPAALTLITGPEETKNLARGGCPPPDSDPLNDVEFSRNLVRLSR
jgi:hypothetical protein